MLTCATNWACLLYSCCTPRRDLLYLIRALQSDVLRVSTPGVAQPMTRKQLHDGANKVRVLPRPSCRILAALSGRWPGLSLATIQKVTDYAPVGWAAADA